MSVITLKNIEYEIGGNLLFKIDKLTIEEGEVVGLIGKNGSGKTSLLKILSGQLQEFSGEVVGSSLVSFNELVMMEHMSKSGGEAAISNFLSSLRNSTSLFLLDEPTTYLDRKNFNKVVKMIKQSNSSFCIASHDRALLEAVATKIWLIDNGKVKEYDCSYTEYLKERSHQFIQYESDLKKYQKEKKKLKDSLQAMKEMRDQKKGKPKKMSSSEYRIAGVKTRINVKQKKLQKGITQQENKLSQLMRPERVAENYDISFLSQVSSLPKRQIVIPAHEAWIGKRKLWNLPAITLKSGDKLGIRGANGSGKTTYLQYLLSVIPVSYKVGYFKQNQINFSDESSTIYSVIAEKSEGRLNESQIRTLLALLNFRGDKVFHKIYQLSRGECVKIALLALLVSDLDILILDEVTNFLDMQTIEAVEKILNLYPGVFIFVSHDYYFMENLASSIINIDDF